MLKEVSAPLGKLCQGIGLPDSACKDLATRNDLTQDAMARKLLELQGAEGGACWESVLSGICKELGQTELAQRMAEEYELPEEVNVCE